MDLLDPLWWHGFVAGSLHALARHHAVLAMVFGGHAFFSLQKSRAAAKNGDGRTAQHRSRLAVAEACFAAANLVGWAWSGGLDRLGLGGVYVSAWFLAFLAYLRAVAPRRKTPVPIAGAAPDEPLPPWRR